jgi:hypothetical protein
MLEVDPKKTARVSVEMFKCRIAHPIKDKVPRAIPRFRDMHGLTMFTPDRIMSRHGLPDGRIRFPFWEPHRQLQLACIRRPTAYMFESKVM